jgi:two-component system, OmpR family, sensor kinase
MSKLAKLSERISRTLCLLVGGLWLVCALGVTWYVDQEITESLDSALVESARRLLDLAIHEVEEQGHGIPAPAPQAAVVTREIAQSDTAKVEDDYLAYQVLDTSGRMLLRSANAPKTQLASRLAEGFGRQGGWRSFSLKHPVHPVWIVVADSMAHRQEVIEHAWLWLSLPLLALLPVLVWLIRRIIQAELKPLQRFSDELGMRGGRNLAALDVPGLPQELQPVLVNANHLLLRLDEALKTERALAADAAHELRTPLASARLLLTTAAAHDDMPGDARQLLQQAMESLDVLSRRAEKLLQLSRAESSAALVQEPVDVKKVVSAVVDEFRLEAGRLAWKPDRCPDLLVLADFDSLAIAIRNLIENSLRHAPDASVWIEIAADATQARVSVCDDGPGASPADMERIRARHARTALRGVGYGLGLSIVHGIVSRQGGVLDLKSPLQGADRGFEAVLWLKLAPNLG